MANAGEIRVDATIDTRGYDSGAANITSTNSRIASSTAAAANAMNKAHGNAGASADDMAGKTELSGTKIAAIWGVVSGVAQNVVSRAFDMVKNSIGAAVDRVDTLNNFPKIMSSLGYSATDAGNQVQRMSDRLQGLPTSLDQMTGMVQKIAPLTGSLSEATDISLAFNDALLAGGKSTSMQSDAMEQYSQMLSVGKVDMMAWRSVVNAMPGQMDQLSKSLLGNKANQMDLYNAMKDGRISFQQFNDAVVALDKQGGGHFKSFRDQAFAATGGIKTGVANAQNAINRGIADIIQDIGASNISSAIAGIGTGFETIAKIVAPVIGTIVRFIGAFAKLPAVQGTVAALAGAFIALGTAMKITAIIQGVTKALTAFKTAQQASTIAQAAFNAIMSVNPFTVIILAIGAVVGALTYFFTQTETGRKVWAGFIDWFKNAWDSVVGWLGHVWDGITQGFSAAVDGVKAVWSGITGFFSGLWDGITSGVKSAADGVQNAWSGIGDYFSGIWDGIVAGFQNIVVNFTSIFSTAWTTVSNIWTTVWTTVSLFFMGIWNGILAFVSLILTTIEGTISSALSTIQSVWDSIWSAVGGFIAPIWSAISSTVSGAIGAVSGAISSTLGAIQGVWTSVWSAVSGFVSSIWGGIVSAVSSGISRVSGVVSGIRGAVLGAVSGAGQWLYDTGSQIINGLGRGISAGFGWIRNLISSMGSNIVGWAKSVLKIGSPSKIMDSQVGQWIPAGIGTGIDKGMPKLRDDLTRQLYSIVPTPYDMGHIIDQAATTVAPRVSIPSAPPSYAAPQPTVSRTVSAPITIQAANPEAAALEAARVINMHYV